MILVWNDVKSFQRHLEEMCQFRRAHRWSEAASLRLLKDMPILFDVNPPENAGRIAGFTGAGGKCVVVPIWKVAPPRGSQN